MQSTTFFYHVSINKVSHFTQGQCRVSGAQCPESGWHDSSGLHMTWQGVRALLDTGLDSMYLNRCVQHACDDDFRNCNTRCHLACHVLQRHENEGLRTCSSCEPSARECHHARNCHQRSERQPMLQISHREVVQVMACCHEGLCAKTLVWVPCNIWQGLVGHCSTRGKAASCAMLSSTAPMSKSCSARCSAADMCSSAKNWSTMRR